MTKILCEYKFFVEFREVLHKCTLLKSLSFVLSINNWTLIQFNLIKNEI